MGMKSEAVAAEGQNNKGGTVFSRSPSDKYSLKVSYCILYTSAFTEKFVPSERAVTVTFGAVL